MNQLHQQNSLRQPKVFLLSSFISAFERFGFYILADALVLYLEKSFGFADHDANMLYSMLNALVYVSPVIGGYLADNVVGIRRSMILGLFTEGLGLLFISLSGLAFLYLGLSLVIIGVGFFRTAPTNILGRAYQENDPRIDTGFTLFYMLMNVGQVIAAILAGFLQRYTGWHIVFLSAAIGIFLGEVVYFILRKDAVEFEVEAGKKTLSIKNYLKIAAAIPFALILFAFLLSRLTIAHMFFYFCTICVIFYLLLEIVKSPKIEKQKIVACLMLILIGIAFFVLYFQLYTSVVLFMDRSVRHNVFGFYMPTIAFLSLNPFWIVAISPLLVKFYNHMSKKNKDLLITTKFSLGLVAISFCFFILKLGTFFTDSNYQISPIWIVLAVALYSLGELLVSALGVAMVTRIAPKRMYGVMMGAWFLIASSVGSILAGNIANLADIPKTMTAPAAILSVYGQTFLEIGFAGIIVAVLSVFIGRYVSKIADL